MINKDTKIYCSFSKKAGNVGCLFFNTYFQENKIDAIYKSFSIENIKEAVEAAKTLQFSGFAVSMPFKAEVVKYLDIKDSTVEKLGQCNTVVIKDSKLWGYNTDDSSVLEYLEENCKNTAFIYILGDGCYSKIVQSCCKELGISYTLITRQNWHDILSIRNSCIFNCTPVDHINIDPSNHYIDCINTSITGADLARKQALKQLKIYNV